MKWVIPVVFVTLFEFLCFNSFDYMVLRIIIEIL
jgi:hypothetical protein